MANPFISTLARMISRSSGRASNAASTRMRSEPVSGLSFSSVDPSGSSDNDATGVGSTMAEAGAMPLGATATRASAGPSRQSGSVGL